VVSCMWYGEQLEHHMRVEAGDFVYIPADMPRLPYTRAPLKTALPSSPVPIHMSKRV
jgi:uncharacterized RmlC-like cupin family protein